MLGPELVLLLPCLDADAARWGGRWEVVDDDCLRLVAHPEGALAHDLTLRRDGRGWVELVIDGRWRVGQRVWRIGVAEAAFWIALVRHCAPTPGVVISEALDLGEGIVAYERPVVTAHPEAGGPRRVGPITRMRRGRALDAAVTRMLGRDVSGQVLVPDDLRATFERPIREHRAAVGRTTAFPDDDLLAVEFLWHHYLFALASRWGARWSVAPDGLLTLIHPDLAHEVTVENIPGERISVVLDEGWSSFTFCYGLPDAQDADEVDGVARAAALGRHEVVDAPRCALRAHESDGFVEFLPWTAHR